MSSFNCQLCGKEFKSKQNVEKHTKKSVCSKKHIHINKNDNETMELLLLVDNLKTDIEIMNTRLNKQAAILKEHIIKRHTQQQQQQQSN